VEVKSVVMALADVRRTFQSVAALAGIDAESSRKQAASACVTAAQIETVLGSAFGSRQISTTIYSAKTTGT